MRPPKREAFAYASSVNNALRSPVAYAHWRIESRVTSVKYGGSLIVIFCPIFARRRASSSSVALPGTLTLILLLRRWHAAGFLVSRHDTRCDQPVDRAVIQTREAF